MSRVNLESIGRDAIMHVLSFLPAEGLACCSATNRYLREISAHDILWKRIMEKDFGISSLGVRAPLYYVADNDFTNDSDEVAFNKLYYEWRTTFMGYPIEQVKRMHLFWSRFKSWCLDTCPDMYHSLNAPATEQELSEAVNHLMGIEELPICLRLMYRFHDGQTLDYSIASSPESLPSIGWGMFGGTDFYDHLTVMYFQPLEDLMIIDPARPSVNEQTFYEHHTGRSHEHICGSKQIIFGTNVTSNTMTNCHKMYAISSGGGDDSGGMIYTNTGCLVARWDTK